MTDWQEDPVSDDYLLPCEVCGASYDREGEQVVQLAVGDI